MNGKNDDGPRNPMADDRAQRSVGPILAAWMDAAAPERAPERLLEESFARTTASRQVRVSPWHTLRRAAQGWSAGTRMAGMAASGMAVVLVIAVTTGLVLHPSPGVGGEQPSPSPSLSPSPSPSEVPFPSPILVSPIATIPVTGAMALATDGSSVWLFTNDGKLVRIDPATNKIGATVTLPSTTDAYQSLAGDPAGLWVTEWDMSKVLRFDPLTLRATASIDVSYAPKGVLVTTAAIWVANTHGGSVARIDPKTNKIVETIVVGPTGNSGPNWLGRGFGSIWTGVPNMGKVFRINEATNAIEASIYVTGPASPCGGLAATSTAIWITSCDGANFVTQIDPATNTVVGTIDLRGKGYTFAVVADRPWLSPTDGQIVRLDPVSHAVDRVVAPGPGFASGGADVVVAAGSMWVMDWAENRVLRLPLDAFEG
jgi:DNA-binding beta-propeller fold protein YncE